MDLFGVLSRFWPNFLSGVGTTLMITAICIPVGAVFALPLAILRDRGNRVLSAPIRLYVSFFRGTPALTQLFLIYYGSGDFRPTLQQVGFWWLFKEPLLCALLAFTLNTIAYQVEIVRGGLQGVAGGEIEAGRAIGMGNIALYRHVILPHAYRLALPALGNEVILLMKSSAIASVITIYDLMGETRRVYARTFDFSAYFWAAVLYLALTTLFVRGWHRIERASTRHQSAQPAVLPETILPMAFVRKMPR